MSLWPRLLVSSLALAASVAVPLGGATAFAQIGPGNLPGPSSPTGQEEPKPEGVAEAAPKGEGVLPSTPVLPPPKTRRKKFELFQLDGYFRLRTDWFKNFNLGFEDRHVAIPDGSGEYAGGAPFPRALGCQPTVTANQNCSDALKSTNMRLRLEPVITLTETTSVHMQVDFLDNVVLGSTPVGSSNGVAAPGNIPLHAFAGGQTVPEQGRNSLSDAVLVRRAWAEVDSPLALLKFGRQPVSWGTGMLFNAGGYDPVSGTYDVDSDYGDTADRVSVSRSIPGTNLSAGLATDWPATAPNASQTDQFNRRVGGQPWDLDDADDVSQWTAMISRLDTPLEFQETLDRGELGFNYGGYFVYRTQQNDYNPAGLDLTTETNHGQLGDPANPNAYVLRDYKSYTLDGWLHFGWDKLDIQLEGAAILGHIGNVSDIGVDPNPENDDTTDIEHNTNRLDIREFGGVFRLAHRSFEDKLKLGLEVGYASGDQWDNLPAGRIHISNARPVPGPNDTTINTFRFNQDYKIDLILFRELIGTVTNATYVRPSLGYDLTRNITFRGQSVISFANEPVATPGNSTMWGVEFDGDVGYTSDSFSAGIAYGVLFPLGALSHPDTIAEEGGTGFGYGKNIGDATTAHTIQTRLAVHF